MKFKANQIVKIKKQDIVGIVDFVDEEPVTPSDEQCYRIRVYNTGSHRGLRNYTLWCYESELEKLDNSFSQTCEIYTNLDLLEIHYGKVVNKMYEQYQKNIKKHPEKEKEYSDLFTFEERKLNRKIIEIRTHLKLCNTYKEKLKVLKKYKIVSIFTFKVK